MRPPARLAQDRLDQGEHPVMILAVPGVDRDRAALALVEGGKPGIVGGDDPRLDREEHPARVAFDPGDHFPQRADLLGDRHVVFHFLEPHRTLVGKQLPAFVDRHFGGNVGHCRAGRAAAQVGGELEQVAQPLEVHQRVAVLIGPARADRFGGGIVGDQRRLAGEWQDQEFGIAVALGQGRPIGQHLLGLDQGDDLLHPLKRAVLQGDFAEHPEGTERDPRGVEQFGALVAAAFDHRTIGQDQPQRARRAVDRGQALAGAVGAGGHGPGQGLLVDIGQVGHFLPDPGEQRAERGQFGPGADRRACSIVADQPGQPVEREQRAFGRDQRGEAVARADRADRGLCAGERGGEVRLARRGGAGCGIGMFVPGPVRPQHPPLPIERRRCLGLAAQVPAPPGHAARAQRQRANPAQQDLAPRAHFAFPRPAMKAISAFRSSGVHSKHWPPAGIPPLPWIALASSASSPRAQRESHSVRSPVSGASESLTVWQALHDPA